MSDSWEFYPCTMGDERAFIFVDVGIANSIDSAPASQARIQLIYKSPHPNGLPTQEEYEPAKAIEDQISAFARAGEDWYVGRITVGGSRYFYVYTKREEADWQTFLSRLQESSGYEFVLTFEDDPEHRGYHDNLAPTPDDWQIIMDMRVLENLQEEGDDGATPRRVDHWAYFPSQEAATSFKAWATGDRFTDCSDEKAQLSDPTRYLVRLFHHGPVTLEHISQHSIALRRKATEHGGSYDGWETQILRTPQS